MFDLDTVRIVKERIIHERHRMDDIIQKYFSDNNQGFDVISEEIEECIQEYIYLIDIYEKCNPENIKYFYDKIIKISENIANEAIQVAAMCIKGKQSEKLYIE